jgi:hypothetical protein
MSLILMNNFINLRANEINLMKDGANVLNLWHYNNKSINNIDIILNKLIENICESVIKYFYED